MWLGEGNEGRSEENELNVTERNPVNVSERGWVPSVRSFGSLSSPLTSFG